jgi:hypothetical protein
MHERLTNQYAIKRVFVDLGQSFEGKGFFLLKRKESNAMFGSLVRNVPLR